MAKKKKKKIERISHNRESVNHLEISYEKQRRILYAITFLIFCLILLLNCLTPLAADDFNYSFVQRTNERVNSFSDVFISQWRHYFGQGGRCVTHAIAQIFLWWGKPIFNIFNSAIFMIFISLICFFSFGKRNVKGILISFLIVWFLLPVPASIFFWLDGACNYLWGPTFVFLLIYRYYKSILEKEEPEEKSPKSLCLTFLWFLFGVIAGWCNENTSGMGILICCLLTLYKYKTSKKVSLWQIMGILGAVIGFVTMIAAPGNYQRASDYSIPRDPYVRLLEGLARANIHAFGAKGIEILIFYLFLFTYLFMVILPTVEKERKMIGGIWFIGALACNYAMMLPPIYPARASCGVFSMYFVSILYAGKTLTGYLDAEMRAKIGNILLCAACLYFSVSYIGAARDIGSTYIRNNQRIETVLEEKSKGNYDISVPRMNPSTKYNVFYSVADWPNYGVTRYYGINSITLTD